MSRCATAAVSRSTSICRNRAADQNRVEAPAILILTPYYRRFALRPARRRDRDPPNAAKYRDFFVPRGYALVVVDVRGTGASFGTRDSFRSPAEREDYREIADWVVAQPWSDGWIGSTGISYLGAAAISSPAPATRRSRRSRRSSRSGTPMSITIIPAACC